MNRGRLIGATVAGAVLLGGAAAVLWPAGAPPLVQQMPEPAARIDGRVSLALGSGPVPEGAMVVVYAYAVDGPTAPLAALRRPATALPLDFSLDDSLGASAEHRLSSAQQLVIGARLGAGGEALSQVGDWLAGSQMVTPGARGVELVLQPPPR